MNSFVNSLLEIILSWVRGIITDIWTIFGGDSGSFFGWLGRHWLSLVCVLIVGGITADLIFYILRWRPQRVWFYKLDRLVRHSEYVEEEKAFSQGYDSGIESFHLDEDPLISQYLNATNNHRFEQYDASVVPQAVDTQENEQPATAHVRHRRRSDRHAKRIGRRNRRFSLTEENSSYSYGYPVPPVDARDAFHDAVYPSSGHNNWGQNQNADRK